MNVGDVELGSLLIHARARGSGDYGAFSEWLVTGRRPKRLPFGVLSIVVVSVLVAVEHPSWPDSQLATPFMAAAAAGFVVALAVYWLLQARSARLPSASCFYARLERNALILVVPGSSRSCLYAGDSTAISAILPSALLRMPQP